MQKETIKELSNLFASIEDIAGSVNLKNPDPDELLEVVEVIEHLVVEVNHAVIYNCLDNLFNKD